MCCGKPWKDAKRKSDDVKLPHKKTILQDAEGNGWGLGGRVVGGGVVRTLANDITVQVHSHECVHAYMSSDTSVFPCMCGELL